MVIGHDLCFESFKFRLKLAAAPFCDLCPGEKYDNKHQLFVYPRYNCDYRDSLYSLLSSLSLAQAILVSQPQPKTLMTFRGMAQIIMK